MGNLNAKWAAGLSARGSYPWSLGVTSVSGKASTSVSWRFPLIGGAGKNL